MTDIGSVGAAGSASVENGVLSIQGSGADIWGTADEFHYFYKPVSGDIDAIAKVDAITNQDPWSKVGIMIRVSSAANSPHLMTVVSSSNGAAFQGRLVSGGSSLGYTASGITTPRWIRIQRTGNTFRSYHSSDGVSWTEIGSSVNLAMPSEVLIGFAITSRSDGNLAAATITETNLLDLSTTTPPLAPSDLQAVLSSSEVHLSWADNSNNEDGFTIERKTDNGSFVFLDDLAENTTSYVDQAVDPGNTYSYRIRSYNSEGSSDFALSNILSIPSVDLFTSEDIGDVGAAGAATIENGVLTIQGSGADIWGTADEFHYYYKTISGDIDAIAKVSSITNEDVWSKVGIMVRATNAANSPHLMTVISASSGAGFHGRLNSGGESLGYQAGGIGVPRWIRLQRTGNTFRSFHSIDGTNWIEIGSQVSLVMPTEVLIGFAITSHSDGNLSTATITETNLLDLGEPSVDYDQVPDAQEYQVLIDLYNSLNGPGWETNTNWTDTNQPLSTWHGVTMVNGDIIEINLPSNNLKGELPNTMHLLETLQVINFSDNQIEGALPVQMARLPELEELYLNDNELGGIVDLEFSVMLKLKTIHLQNNNFRSIPDYSFNNHVDKSQVSLKAENNKLEFLYIENNIGLTPSLQEFTYIPQQPYGEAKVIGFIVGNEMTLKLKMLGEDNFYQWEFNEGSGWTTIGTNSPNYEKAAIVHADAGRYRCRISNSKEATGFEIVSKEIEVKVDEGHNATIVNRPLN